MAKKTMARGDGHQRKFAKPKSKARPKWVAEALRLQARGHDFDSIALILDLSPATVKAHIDPHTITVANVRERNMTRAEKEAKKARERDRTRLKERRRRADGRAKP